MKNLTNAASLISLAVFLARETQSVIITVSSSEPGLRYSFMEVKLKKMCRNFCIKREQSKLIYSDGVQQKSYFSEFAFESSI